MNPFLAFSTVAFFLTTVVAGIATFFLSRKNSRLRNFVREFAGQPIVNQRLRRMAADLDRAFKQVREWQQKDLPEALAGTSPAFNNWIMDRVSVELKKKTFWDVVGIARESGEGYVLPQRYTDCTARLQGVTGIVAANMRWLELQDVYPTTSFEDKRIFAALAVLAKGNRPSWAIHQALQASEDRVIALFLELAAAYLGEDVMSCPLCERPECGSTEEEIATYHEECAQVAHRIGSYVEPPCRKWSARVPWEASMRYDVDVQVRPLLLDKSFGSLGQ